MSKTSWSSIARDQADKAHKTEVDALKAKLAQYAASAADLEKQLAFPHWQPGSRQLLYQTGYRQLSGKPQAKTKEPTTRAVPGIPAHLLERVTQTCLRYAGYSPSDIADRCRWTGEPRIKAPAIRALLDTLTP